MVTSGLVQALGHLWLHWVWQYMCWGFCGCIGSGTCAGGFCGCSGSGTCAGRFGIYAGRGGGGGGLGMCGGGFVSGGFYGFRVAWCCAWSTGTTTTCGSNGGICFGGFYLQGHPCHISIHIYVWDLFL